MKIHNYTGPVTHVSQVSLQGLSFRCLKGYLLLSPVKLHLGIPRSCRPYIFYFKFLFAFLVFTCYFLLWDKHKVLAQDMTSQNFKIQQGNFNMTSGNKESANFKLADVVGQTAAGIFISKGYIINAGFLNGAAGDLFTFSIDPHTINFETLSPDTFTERVIHISISNGNATGFSVRVAENKPLSTSVGAQIPDTSCDSPTAPCTTGQASLWSHTTTYGFGYQVAGRTVAADFSKENYFRPFPATIRNEQPALIMLTQAKKIVDQSKMTLRVNTASKQPVGQYKNILQFTALIGI